MLRIEDRFKLIQRSSPLDPTPPEMELPGENNCSANSTLIPSSTSRGKTAKGTKKCAKCAETKEFEAFPRRDDTSDGHASYCKACQNELNKQRRLKNASARLKHHIYTRVAKQYEGNLPEKATTNLEAYLGYSIGFLAQKLDKDVRKDYGMTLKQAFSKNFHLDHIKALKNFPTDELGDVNFRACWSIDNLKMVPAAVNLKKGSKDIEYEDIELDGDDE